MPLDWRHSLQTLEAQFLSRASATSGLFHMMIEAGMNNCDGASTPPWFKGLSDNYCVIDGKIHFSQWECSRWTGMPCVPPSFRSPSANESFGEHDRVIRDQCGIVRAVAVPQRNRWGYYCGRPSEEIGPFESLANMAALALLDANDLSDNPFASELQDLFRQPRGIVRYVFGEVSEVPPHPICSGWNAGVLQDQNGVLIDVPISESTPNAEHWVLLLHRLGWKRPKGSPLTANRACWGGNTEIAYDAMHQYVSRYPTEFKERFAGVSKDRFYSLLGTKDAPIDLHLASAFAINTTTLSQLESALDRRCLIGLLQVGQW